MTRPSRSSVVSVVAPGRYHVRLIACRFLRLLFEPDPQRPDSGCDVQRSIVRLSRRQQKRLRNQVSQAADLDARVKEQVLKQLTRHGAAYPVRVEFFGLMDNHLHLVIHVDPTLVDGWSDAEVAERWLTLHPGALRNDPEALGEEILRVGSSMDPEDVEWREEIRERLRSLSWFMHDLAQRVAQGFNRVTGGKGPLWAGRFRCDAVGTSAFDVEAQAAVGLYAELNPLRAGLCERPEDGLATSLEARLSHAGRSGPIPLTGSCCTAPRIAAAQRARTHRCGLSEAWLPAFAAEDPEAVYQRFMAEGQLAVPTPERERATRLASERLREARRDLFTSWTLDDWLALVDRAARRFVTGKSSLAWDALPIGERLAQLGAFARDELGLPEPAPPG